MNNQIHKKLHQFKYQDNEIIEFMSDLFFDWLGHLDNNILHNEWMSAEFYEKLGYTSNDIKNTLWKDILIQEDEEKIQNTLLENQEASKIKLDLLLRYQLPNNTITTTKFRGIAIKERKGIFTIMGGHEILIAEKPDQKLIAENLMLKQQNEELKQFSHLASHDLQQPINNIISYLSLLEENRNDLNDLGKLSVDIIKKSSYKMKRLISALLDYAIIGNKIGTEIIAIEEVLENVKDILSEKIKEKSIDLQINIEQKKIMAHKNDIQLLFLNLIENAIKFSTKTNVPIIKVASEIKNDHILFSISDNGIGIKEVHFDKIFDLFYTIDRDNSENLGAGLAQCKKIIQLYSGKIWLQSTIGKGTTFYCTLPK